MQVTDETTKAHKITLELSDREVAILVALTDFPMWDEQPDDVEEFLQSFNDQLTYATGVYTSAEANFNNKTSLEEV